MKKSAWLKRARVFPRPVQPTDLSEALGSVCRNRKWTAKRRCIRASNGAVLSLHKYRERDGFFLGQVSRFTPEKSAEVIRLADEDQVEAEEFGSPPNGGDWVESSLFFVSYRSLVAVCATQAVSASDLMRLLSYLLLPSGAGVLEGESVVLNDIQTQEAFSQLTGVRNVKIETTVDAFTLDSTPSLAEDAMHDSDGTGVAEVTRVARSGINWGGMRPLIARMVDDVLHRDEVSLDSMRADQRLRIRLEIFAEGGDRSSEHEIANALGSLLRISPDVKHLIDLGKYGQIKQDQLRLQDYIPVGDAYGAGALDAVGNALASWLVGLAEAHSIPVEE